MSAVDQVFIGTTSYGRHWLEPSAAASWQRMVRDGCPPGGITDAGRTDAEQIAVFLKYFTQDYASSAKHDRRTWQGRAYWRRPGKPSAATPGSVQARHTFGRALDLNGSTKTWVRANGHRYGWIKDLVPGEDWHMEYQPARDVAPVSNPGIGVPGRIPSAPSLTPVAPIPQEDVVVSRAENQQDMAAAVQPLASTLAEVRTALAQIRAGGYAYRLDGGGQGVFIEAGAHSRVWLDQAAYAAAGRPDVLPLPPDSGFWARTVLYSPGELYSREGGDGAAYVLAGRATDGGACLRHIARGEYEAMGSPTITRLPDTHTVWARPVIG